MLEVADKKHYAALKGKRLKSVYRYSKHEWRCIMWGGKLLHVKFKAGVIAMTVADAEYDLGDNIMLVAVDGKWKKTVGKIFEFDSEMKLLSQEDKKLLKETFNPPPKKEKKQDKLRELINFNEIKNFMDWKCKEDNIWDCFYD